MAAVLIGPTTKTTTPSVTNCHYPPYRKVLRPPAKEASVVAYKNLSTQLGHLKRGTSSHALKDYYTARQTLLRSDLDQIIALQCQALGLKVPTKSASQSQNLAMER
jgi:hypothetical protein